MPILKSVPDADPAIELIRHVLVRVVAHEDGIRVCLCAEVVGFVVVDEVTHVGVLLAVELYEVEVQAKIVFNVLLGVAIDEGVVCVLEGLETCAVAKLLDAHVAVDRP